MSKYMMKAENSNELDILAACILLEEQLGAEIIEILPAS